MFTNLKKKTKTKEENGISLKKKSISLENSHFKLEMDFFSWLVLPHLCVPPHECPHVNFL